MTSWEFPGSDPIDILIDMHAGSIAVSAEPTTVTTVGVQPADLGRQSSPEASDVQVSFTHGRLEITQPSAASFLRGRTGVDLTVKAPPGSRCTIRAASADVGCAGDLAELEAKTASGDLTVASVSGPVSVTTASGDVRLETGGATVEVRTASGDIRLRDAAGDVSLQSASGDIRLGTAAASVEVNTASGDIQVSSVAAGRTSVKTVSGDIAIGVAAGVSSYLDLSSLTGRIKNQLEETDGGDDVGLRVTCRSVSGDIQISRAH
jgi:DUF4097 and DUF4098 domain-containing protein YvlB